MYQPKAREAVGEVLKSGDLGRRTVGLLVVDVDDADQVVELPVPGTGRAFPHRALAALAIGEQAVDEGIRLLALEAQSA